MYLSLKKAFSVRPVQAVATASQKVEIPKLVWMGTMAARKEAVADSQHKSSKKLKNPATNWKTKTSNSRNLEFQNIYNLILKTFKNKLYL